jgi:23S rRNA (guanosine2251-2'-O)-methyltransferase
VDREGISASGQSDHPGPRKRLNDELERLTPETFRTSSKTPLILVLDNVRSLNNIGSIFRTADAFLIEAIYLCGITACPPHKDIQKTALGATESVAWVYFKTTLQALDSLRNKGFKVLAIEQVEGSVLLNQFMPEKEIDYAVVFGHEVFGIEQEVVNACDACIEIPQFGTKHSLNIAVTAGIVVWDLFLKLR